MPLSSDESKSACHAALRSLRKGDPAPMRRWLHEHLFAHVLPFWESHGLDPAGGLHTCVADNGELLSEDKWLWSQWRAVWVFSRVYNRHGRDSRWLERAQAIAEFCIRHGWDSDRDGWALQLGSDGRQLRGAESIYTDAFAISGLMELNRATNDPRLVELMRRTADAAARKLSGSRDAIPHFPYPIPAGAKPHGLPMFWSLILAELGDVTDNDGYREAATGYAREIFRDFYRRDRDALVEFVGSDGRELPPPQGTIIVPGHALESMWFHIHVSEFGGQSGENVAEACRLISRHLELGWDSANGGGLILAIDADGREPVAWRFAESKLWWPQTEALYAALLAWTKTGDDAFLDWYERVWRVCLDHFVNWEHGEWRQKLARNFTPMVETVALPVKDPFHLPRSLLLQIELLERASTS